MRANYDETNRWFTGQMSQSMELMNLCLEGKEFYYRYDQFRLKTCITIAYLGWASVLVVFLVQDRIKHGIHSGRPKRKESTFRKIDQIGFFLSVLLFIILTGKMISGNDSALLFIIFFSTALFQFSYLRFSSVNLYFI